MNSFERDGRILNQRITSVRFILGELGAHVGCEGKAFSRPLSLLAMEKMTCGKSGYVGICLVPVPPSNQSTNQPFNHSTIFRLWLNATRSVVFQLKAQIVLCIATVDLRQVFETKHAVPSPFNHSTIQPFNHSTNQLFNHESGRLNVLQTKS